MTRNLAPTTIGKLTRWFTSSTRPRKFYRLFRLRILEELEHCSLFAVVLDPGFGDSGTALSGLTGTGSATALVRQPDGKIIVAGKSHSLLSDRFYLARYNSDGTLDTSFGNGGTVTTSIGTDAQIKGIALQANGKIVTVGESLQGLDYAIAVALQF